MPNVLMRINFRSQVLALQDAMNVILPDDRTEGEFPVLWLLHGGGGNENDWVEETGIRRYADQRKIAVVMPHAGYSRYCNMYWGADYFDFLTQELPKIVKHMFPRVSTKREDNFIAGLSLGGSGAISLGMRRPDLYGAIGVLSASSVIPLEYLRAKSAGGPAAPGGPGHKSVNMVNFGVEDTNDLKGNPEHDVLLNAENVIREHKPVPKVYHAVGTEDHAYPVGLGLKEFFEGFEGNPFRYEFHTEHGAHNWEFWDKWIQAFLDAALKDRGNSMSLIRMELNSECLTRKASITVILPELSEERKLPNGKYPVLWLLHGATDDQSMWQRFTSLELYAQKRGIAVVMPAVENSFYTNTDGGRYFDYVTEELPRMLQSYLPISPEREDNFIAGMSMGGHGTMKLGFTKPELYAAMGIFSCANFIDLMGAGNMLEGGRRVPLNFVRWQVFGTDDGDLTKVHETEHDNRYLARLASESGKPLPKIFGCCGTADGCHDSEKKDFAYFSSLPNPFDVVFFDSPGFHYFDFWDEWLKVFIQWLPIRKREKEIL